MVEDEKEVIKEKSDSKKQEPEKTGDPSQVGLVEQIEGEEEIIRGEKFKNVMEPTTTISTESVSPVLEKIAEAPEGLRGPRFFPTPSAKQDERDSFSEMDYSKVPIVEDEPKYQSSTREINAPAAIDMERVGRDLSVERPEVQRVSFREQDTNSSSQEKYYVPGKVDVSNVGKSDPLKREPIKYDLKSESSGY